MLETVPWMKLVYSGLLALLAGILIRELWTVWTDKRIYIGSFDVVTGAGGEDASSTLFPRQIVGSQKILVNQLAEYQSGRTADAAADVTYLTPGVLPLNIPAGALPGLDITYQEVNFTKIFATLRKSFRSPNEVRGTVTGKPGAVQVAVEWPKAPTPAGGGVPLRSFLTPPQATAQDAAEYVACSISWANAASLSKQVAAWPRAQFCEWTGALGDYYALASKASVGAGLDAAETATVRRRAGRLRSHFDDRAVFAEVYRLRADLLDLLPEAARTQTELVDAQEDRVRYAMLNPALDALPPEEKRFAALALARPAILFDANGKTVLPGNWKALLTPRWIEIAAAAAATGVIYKNGLFIGTGFFVGPGLLMTSDHVLDMSDTDSAKNIMTFLPSEAVHDALSPGTQKMLTIGEIIYDGAKDGSRVMVARVSGHNAILLPPLTISAPLTEANEVTGRYAFIIGYPAHDWAVPPSFIERLLGGIEFRQRLMPGRILAFGPADSALDPEKATSLKSEDFTTDISTSKGTAGAPLIDLASGKVIGLHYAGRWQGERGKFEYSQAIPPEAIAAIAAARTSSKPAAVVNGTTAAVAPAPVTPRARAASRATTLRRKPPLTP